MCVQHAHGVCSEVAAQSECVGSRSFHATCRIRQVADISFWNPTFSRGTYTRDGAVDALRAILAALTPPVS